jgi:antitoxin (DNA-binding transcriptional repressor) of toxin-antitoxin stability system
MAAFNVYYAKTHFSRLLEQVERGEEVLIARNGEPVAMLVALQQGPRKPGRLKGRIQMAEDFDAPLPAAVLAAWNGEGE